MWYIGSPVLQLGFRDITTVPFDMWPMDSFGLISDFSKPHFFGIGYSLTYPMLEASNKFIRPHGDDNNENYLSRGSVESNVQRTTSFQFWQRFLSCNDIRRNQLAGNLGGFLFIDISGFESYHQESTRSKKRKKKNDIGVNKAMIDLMNDLTHNLRSIRSCTCSGATTAYF